MTTSLLAGVALLVGVIIGTVGIGGVVLAPALILIGGIEPHRATAISLISFTLAGVVSLALHLRAGAVPRRLTRDLSIGLLPGAFIGGWLSDWIPDVIILAALSAVCLASALWSIVRRRAAPAEGEREDLGVATAAPIGIVVGFGSALTGTSGPVLLTPVLMALRLATGRAIVVGQVIQVVVTPAGALGSLARARPDLGRTVLLGAAVAAGTAIGIYGARRLPPPDAVLRDLVAALLAGTGVLIAIRLAA
jgi:uncharacterized membrane protein YfcA